MVGDTLMGSENLDWIKENVKIFIDQNICEKAKESLLLKGYKNVVTVKDIGYIGANDGKILRIIKDNKMVLLTFDKKFHKQACKYNEGMSVLLTTTPTSPIRERKIANRAEQTMFKKYKELRKYYEEE